MYKKLVFAAALAVSGGQAMAELKAAPGNHWNQGGLVTVSCYRGPFKDVIWDRPEAVFIESLVSVGYDYTNALAIGNRICRDSALVDDNAALKLAMETIITDAPH